MKRIVCLGALLLASALHPGGLAQEGVSNAVTVLTPPSPIYPRFAIEMGIEGKCEIEFDLLEYGRLIVIRQVSCSSQVFCSTSSKAILESQFQVVDVKGTEIPGERWNIVYPISFCVSTNGLKDRVNPPLQLCVDELVS